MRFFQLSSMFLLCLSFFYSSPAISSRSGPVKPESDVTGVKAYNDVKASCTLLTGPTRILGQMYLLFIVRVITVIIHCIT